MTINKKRILYAISSVILFALLTTSFVSGMTHDVSDYEGNQVSRNFFKDDGEVNVKIVVGSDAAFEDIRTATDIEYEIRKQLIERKDLHMQTSDDSKIHIPVFSNFYNRPGNIDRSDELIQDYEYEDLRNNEDWYKTAVDDNFKGFDWTENGILKGSFDNDDPDQIRSEFSFEVPKEVRILDDSTGEYINLNLDLNFEIGNIEDLDDNGLPAKNVDLDLEKESILADFSKGNSEEYGNIFGEEKSINEFDGLELGDQVKIFNNTFNIAGIEDNSFYHGTKYDEVWVNTGESISFGNFTVTVRDVDTSNGADETFIEVEDSEGDEETSVMKKGEYKDFEKNITINVKNIFSGVEGTNSVQISAIVGKEDVQKGSNWPTSNYIVRKIDTSGETIKSIELKLREPSVEEEKINFRDYWKIRYEYKEIIEDPNNDGISEYGFESWLEFTKIPDTDPKSFNIISSDNEINRNTDKNLILIGGPLANDLTKQMKENGESNVNWHQEENGKIEYLKRSYGKNNVDVLIVSGASRWSTKDAAQNLIKQLKS